MHIRVKCGYVQKLSGWTGGEEHSAAPVMLNTIGLDVHGFATMPKSRRQDSGPFWTTAGTLTVGLLCFILLIFFMVPVSVPS